MLLLPDGSLFAVGRVTFSDDAPGLEEQTAKIYVKVQPEGLEAVILAQVDTGSAWSVLAREYAEVLALLDGEGEPIALSTRHGRIRGRLEKATLTIVADEGESLEVQEATVFVSREWPGGTFLGYSGLLDRLRFAVDPSNNSFYFGPLQVDGSFVAGGG